MRTLIAILAAVLWGVGGVAWADSWSVREEIFKAIEKEQSFGGYEIEIDARMGKVVVDGKVASEEARNRVEEIARAQHGVREVVNRLVVDARLASGAGPGSTIVAERVRTVILGLEGLGSFDLEVVAKGAQVTLRGSVARPRDREEIERAAKGVSGVAQVLNEMTVRGAAKDAEITARVIAALKAEQGIEVSDLDVRTENGVVILRGVRANHRERDQILSVVLGVPGVRDIRSELR